MKIAVLAPVALALASLGLASCGGEKQPAAEAKPGAPEGISISDGRLVLPAVKGNPGAVYFTVHNDSGSQKMIRGASVEGAQSAMIHQMASRSRKVDMQELTQLGIPANGELEFKPGELHVMAMNLDDTLAKGGTAEVTLTFVGGDRASFPAEILAAGDAR